MNWIYKYFDGDKACVVEALETRLDVFVSDSSVANHEVISEIRDRTKEALDNLDTTVGNLGVLKEYLAITD